MVSSTSLPAEQRQDAEALITLMRDVTGEPPKLWGSKIIGFGQYHYRYASGREGDAAAVGFAPRGKQLTLYLLSGMVGYDDLLGRLGKHTTGKACVYIRRLADVDRDVLRQLIERSVSHTRQVEAEMGGLPRMSAMPDYRPADGRALPGSTAGGGDRGEAAERPARGAAADRPSSDGPWRPCSARSVGGVRWHLGGGGRRLGGLRGDRDHERDRVDQVAERWTAAGRGDRPEREASARLAGRDDVVAGVLAPGAVPSTRRPRASSSRCRRRHPRRSRRRSERASCRHPRGRDGERPGHRRAGGADHVLVERARGGSR